MGDGKRPIVGIFVGGKGRRMGGVAKGNLLYGGQTLLGRLVALCEQHSLGADDLYLVGESHRYEGFAGARLSDSPEGIGPLGGLRALLLQAHRLGRDAVALAVDLPYVQPKLLARLLSSECPGALAPRQEGRWQPLFCRYRSEPSLEAVEQCLHGKRHALQAVLDALGSSAIELPLTAEEQLALRDWDCPADVVVGRSPVH